MDFQDSGEGLFEQAVALSRKFYAVPVATSSWDRAEYAAIARCVANGALVSGTGTARLEQAVSKTFGLPGVAGVNSGETGLYCAAAALPRGMEVIVPSYVCGSVVYPLEKTGLTPVFADVETDYNLSLERVSEKITPRTSAVIVPSLYGKPAALAAFEKLARDENVVLIDDAAQSLGAVHAGRPVGSFGALGGYSFGAKNVTATGGGMLVSKKPRNETAANALRRARGLEPEKTLDVAARLTDRFFRYSLRKASLPFLTAKFVLEAKLGRTGKKPPRRLSNLDAELALVQLEKLPQLNRKRVENARMLLDELASTSLELPEPGRGHIFYRFVVRLPSERNERRRERWSTLLQFVRGMAANGVECEWCYTPLHLQAFAHRAPRRAAAADLTNTERLWWRSIALPNHPGLTPDDMAKTAAAAKRVLRDLRL